jgi:hypothetical protein
VDGVLAGPVCRLPLAMRPPLLAGNQYIDAKNHSINFLNQFELTKLIFVKIREEMPRRLNAIAD